MVGSRRSAAKLQTLGSSCTAATVMNRRCGDSWGYGDLNAGLAIPSIARLQVRSSGIPDPRRSPLPLPWQAAVRRRCPSIVKRQTTMHRKSDNWPWPKCGRPQRLETRLVGRSPCLRFFPYLHFRTVVRLRRPGLRRLACTMRTARSRPLAAAINSLHPVQKFPLADEYFPVPSRREFRLERLDIQSVLRPRRPFPGRFQAKFPVFSLAIRETRRRFGRITA